MAHKLGLIGVGAIARKQHLPAIAANPAFELVAAASIAGEIEGNPVPFYRDHRAMLADHPEIEAVVICTPPRARLAPAADALAAGKHVLLEKPPAMTVGEIDHIAGLAARAGRVLHTAWHSQYNRGVERAAELLAGKTLASLHIDWKENVHKYHPGQTWIWQAGGFGVFDAGVNGLSILTRILDPMPFVVDATLDMPAGAEVAIAAEVTFSNGTDAKITGSFDWDWRGPDTREIRLTTTDGMTIELTNSGGRLVVDGTELLNPTRTEYADIYAHFDALLRAGTSSVHTAPLSIYADILLAGRPRAVGPVTP